MFVIIDPPLDYRQRWETIGIVCSYEPSLVFTQYLNKARRRAGYEKGDLEMITCSMTSCTVTAIYNPHTRKVVAQVESMMQDGCVPPVHYVLAHAKPINTHYEQN